MHVIVSTVRDHENETTRVRDPPAPASGNHSRAGVGRRSCSLPPVYLLVHSHLVGLLHAALCVLTRHLGITLRVLTRDLRILLIDPLLVLLVLLLILLLHALIVHLHVLLLHALILRR